MQDPRRRTRSSSGLAGTSTPAYRSSQIAGVKDWACQGIRIAKGICSDEFRDACPDKYLEYKQQGITCPDDNPDTEPPTGGPPTGGPPTGGYLGGQAQKSGFSGVLPWAIGLAGAGLAVTMIKNMTHD